MVIFNRIKIDWLMKKLSRSNSAQSTAYSAMRCGTSSVTLVFIRKDSKNPSETGTVRYQICGFNAVI